MKKYNFKDKTGAISAFTMISMAFFIVVILGAYVITSRRAQTQTQSVETIQNYYEADGEEQYNKKIAVAGSKIPIYTKEQLWSIGENVSIEIDGIVYDFSSTEPTRYELKNDIVININDLRYSKFKDNYVINNTNGYEILYYYNGNYYTLLNYSGTSYATGTAVLSASGTNFANINDTTTGLTGNYYIFANNQWYNSRHPELHIPTGYHYLLGTVDDGYVITDDATPNGVDDGNEFVWIPVSSSSEYVKTMGVKNYYISSNSASSAEQPDLNSIAGDKLGTFPNNNVINSNTNIVDRPEASVVNSAGGFWVGRYEAGVPNVERSTYIANTQTSSNSAYTASNTYWSGTTIYSKLNYEPVRMITQSKSLELANNFGHDIAGEGTVAWQSGLITGAEWDAVCRFIGQSVCDSDCTTWGNYRKAQSKAYTDLYHSSDNSSDWIHSTSSISKLTSNNRWIFPTGIFVNNSNETTEKKHIFDIAGNVWEWTTEAPNFDTSHAVIRGGSVSNDGGGNLASTRYGYFSATILTYYHIGFRLVLYVK